MDFWGLPHIWQGLPVGISIVEVPFWVGFPSGGEFGGECRRITRPVHRMLSSCRVTIPNHELFSNRAIICPSLNPSMSIHAHVRIRIWLSLIPPFIARSCSFGSPPGPLTIVWIMSFFLICVPSKCMDRGERSDALHPLDWIARGSWNPAGPTRANVYS
jgi:hypothetical protein